MKCAIIILSVAAVCSALPAKKAKTAEDTTTKPKQISTPWFSVSPDGQAELTSPWFSSVTNADGTKQIVTPWFSTAPDGTKQITGPFFSAEISEPADPLLPSTFKFKTPFSVQPVAGAVEQPSIFAQILEQANAQQEVDLQQLVALIGQENTEVLLNALVGHYSEVKPWQYQNFQQALQFVGSANVQELLNSFAGEKLKFTTQYGKESVKVPATVVLDKILEKLSEQVVVPQTQYPSQYPVGQFPYAQGQQVVPYQFAGQQGFYGQQSQYPNQYASQYSNGQQYGTQFGQQGQYASSTLRDYYYPLTQNYQQVQYSPYQQYAPGYQQYQPTQVYAY